jgi:hypothetical protein
MKQICITFDDELQEKLRRNAKEKNTKLGQYIRNLVDLGLRVEEMSAQKKAEGDKPDPLTEEFALFKKLLQKNLVSSYEMLYLIRHILTKMPEKTPGEHRAFADQAETKAQSFVAGLLDKMPM